MIQKERLTALLQKLIQAPSENPPGNEVAASKIIESVFSSAGLEVRTKSFRKKRVNVIGVLKGKSSESPIALVAHIDTVPAGSGWEEPPFSGKIKDGKLYGRGATDNKCHVAILGEIAASMKEDGLVPAQDILFVSMADEETGGTAGLKPLLESNALYAKNALLMDGEGFKVNIAQKGLVHARATIFGIKAHGAYPERGRNAIEDASKIIVAFKKYPINCKKHLILGGPTINIGTIHGGDQVNIVADKCEFDIDARFPPPLSCKLIKEHMNNVIANKCEKYELKIEDELEPVQIDEKDALVSDICFAIKKAGHEPKVGGSAGSTLLALLVKNNINCASTGFGAVSATHTTNEYVVVEDVFAGARAIEAFIKKHVGAEKK